MPQVSVIVVTLDRRELLRGCLEALDRQTFSDFETIVVDNGSTDGTSEMLRADFPQVILVHSGTNLGFGGGNNLGMRRASGELIALLNNDAEPEPGWLEALVRAAQDAPDATGMWASKVLLAGTNRVIDTVGHRLYGDGLNVGRGRGERDDGQYDRAEEVLLPSGCAMLLSRRMLDEIGELDEDFFAYGDDAEIGLRARLAGWRCILVPEAVVQHAISGTLGRYSARKVYLVERNRVWLMVKHFPWRYVLVSPLKTGLRLAHHARAALAGRGMAGGVKREASWIEVASTLARADLDALLGLPKMLAKRRRGRATRRVSAGEFGRWLRRFGVSARELAGTE